MDDTVTVLQSPQYQAQLTESNNEDHQVVIDDDEIQITPGPTTPCGELSSQVSKRSAPEIDRHPTLDTNVSGSVIIDIQDSDKEVLETEFVTKTIDTKENKLQL